MRGQWRGYFDGTNSGEIVLELDEFDDCYEGSAYLYEGDPALPGTFAHIRTSDKGSRQSIAVNIHPIDPRTGAPTTFAQIAELYPDVVFGQTAKAELAQNGDSITASWETNLGTTGSIELQRSDASKPSACAVLPITTWREFKDYAVALPQDQFIFRGQPGSWRLRTSFHRSGRANLDRYLSQDMPAVHRQLSATTKHRFDTRDPLQNAAFFNLLQHHGFPTPLLDWTYSPFVGAFFAYQPIGTDDAVRIYVFDKARWCRSFNQAQNTNSRRPHFSILEALAIENDRMLPQQALLSFTNVDDVEGHIRAMETANTQFLAAIDLPRVERATVLRELRLMGITSSSMFPGLDGACAELKARFFGD